MDILDPASIPNLKRFDSLFANVCNGSWTLSLFAWFTPMTLQRVHNPWTSKFKFDSTAEVVVVVVTGICICFQTFSSYGSQPSRTKFPRNCSRIQSVFWFCSRFSWLSSKRLCALDRLSTRNWASFAKLCKLFCTFLDFRWVTWINLKPVKLIGNTNTFYYSYHSVLFWKTFLNFQL